MACYIAICDGKFANSLLKEHGASSETTKVDGSHANVEESPDIARVGVLVIDSMDVTKIIAHLS